MEKQKVPDIEWGFWTISVIPQLITDGEIHINKEYQRGDIWRHSQKVELIKSIENCYSIGVLVLFMNDSEQFEILDGQQRLQTINQYLNDKLDLANTGVKKYSELTLQEKTLLDAYCVYHIRLKSHDPKSKEEDIVQTFLRLQEGTPLNKAEKLNAHRGEFKNTFREVRDTHPIFDYLGKEKRFRWRLLAAEMLTLEMESDFNNLVFPSLDLETMVNVLKKYENNISSSRVRFFKGNLDYLSTSLNMILTAFKPREFIAFYMLVSYLRKKKAGNKDLMNELAVFAREFLQNLNSFGIYEENPPEGMDKDIFDKYKTFKLESKIMTTPESLKKRCQIMIDEFTRMHPWIEKDEKRLHDAEQKRVLYFKQKGICPVCGKVMDFRSSSAHHVIAHSEGGKTDDLSQAALVHERCHVKLEKLKAKNK